MDPTPDSPPTDLTLSQAKEIVSAVESAAVSQTSQPGPQEAIQKPDSITLPPTTESSAHPQQETLEYRKSAESSPYSDEPEPPQSSSSQSPEDFKDISGLLKQVNAQKSLESLEDLSYDKVRNLSDHPERLVEPTKMPELSAYFGDPMTQSIVDYDKLDQDFGGKAGELESPLKLSPEDGDKKSAEAIDKQADKENVGDKTFDMDGSVLEPSILSEEPPSWIMDDSRDNTFERSILSQDDSLPEEYGKKDDQVPIIPIRDSASDLMKAFASAGETLEPLLETSQLSGQGLAESSTISDSNPINMDTMNTSKDTSASTLNFSTEAPGQFTQGNDAFGTNFGSSFGEPNPVADSVDEFLSFTDSGSAFNPPTSAPVYEPEVQAFSVPEQKSPVPEQSSGPEKTDSVIPQHSTEDDFQQHRIVEQFAPPPMAEVRDSVHYDDDVAGQLSSAAPLSTGAALLSDHFSLPSAQSAYDDFSGVGEEEVMDVKGDVKEEVKDDKDVTDVREEITNVTEQKEAQAVKREEVQKTQDIEEKSSKFAEEPVSEFAESLRTLAAKPEATSVSSHSSLSSTTHHTPLADSLLSSSSSSVPAPPPTSSSSLSSFSSHFPSSSFAEPPASTESEPTPASTEPPSKTTVLPTTTTTTDLNTVPGPIHKASSSTPEKTDKTVVEPKPVKKTCEYSEQSSSIMGRKNNRRDNSQEFNDNSSPDAVYEYLQTTLGPNAAELVYWRDPKASGVVFGAGLAILFSLTAFSVISVVSNTLMLAVLGGLGAKIYIYAQQIIKKTEASHPFKEYLDFEFNPSKDRTQEIVDQVLSHATCFVNKMRSVLLVEDLVVSIKYLIVFWLFTYIGAWFNGMTLIILTFIGAFSLPKVYENNKSQIDSYLDLINGKINEVTNKVPFLKKAEAEKED